MGIAGLLQQLKPFVNDLTGHPRSIRDYEGATLCVDASSWLHKASFAFAADLDKAGGEERCAPRYIKSFMKRVEALLYIYKVKRVILVYDGQRIPLKAGENRRREEARQEVSHRDILCINIKRRRPLPAYPRRRPYGRLGLWKRTGMGGMRASYTSSPPSRPGP